MCLRPLIATLLFLALGIGVCACTKAPPDPVEIPTAQLPGSVRDNAGKAIRTLFDSIERRAGLVGFDLSSKMRDEPEQFFGDVPEIVRAVSIEACDWGIEPDWSAILAHSPAVNGFHSVLVAHARSRAQAGDSASAADSLKASIRLARHASAGSSVLEKLIALKQVRESADATTEQLDAGLLDPQDANRIAEELVWLHGTDPLQVKAAIRLEGQMVTEALLDGRISREKFAGVDGGSWSPPGRLKSRHIAPYFQPAYDRIADAWDRPDFLVANKAVRDDLERDVDKHSWLLTHFDRLHERWEKAAAAVAALESRLHALE